MRGMAAGGERRPRPTKNHLMLYALTTRTAYSARTRTSGTVCGLRLLSKIIGPILDGNVLAIRKINIGTDGSIHLD